MFKEGYEKVNCHPSFLPYYLSRLGIVQGWHVQGRYARPLARRSKYARANRRSTQAFGWTSQFHRCGSRSKTSWPYNAKSNVFTHPSIPQTIEARHTFGPIPYEDPYYVDIIRAHVFKHSGELYSDMHDEMINAFTDLLPSHAKGLQNSVP